MKTLFIDSSRKTLSVALVNEDGFVFKSNVNTYSKHSNFLMNEINKGLNTAKVNVSEIDNFVVLNGPGSFTGIRVGITVAKTLAWVLGKKMYVLNNLEALKVGNQNEVLITTIYDKPDHSYVGIYEGNKVVEDYLSIDDDKLKMKDKNITIISLDECDFVNKLYDNLKQYNNVNLKIIDDYEYLKVINYALLKPSINPHLIEPIYLKKIDAQKK